MAGPKRKAATPPTTQPGQSAPPAKRSRNTAAAPADNVREGVRRSTRIRDREARRAAEAAVRAVGQARATLDRVAREARHAANQAAVAAREAADRAHALAIAAQAAAARAGLALPDESEHPDRGVDANRSHVISVGAQAAGVETRRAQSDGVEEEMGAAAGDDGLSTERRSPQTATSAPAEDRRAPGDVQPGLLDPASTSHHGSVATEVQPSNLIAPATMEGRDHSGQRVHSEPPAAAVGRAADQHRHAEANTRQAQNVPNSPRGTRYRNVSRQRLEHHYDGARTLNRIDSSLLVAYRHLNRWQTDRLRIEDSFLRVRERIGEAQVVLQQYAALKVNNELMATRTTAIRARIADLETWASGLSQVRDMMRTQIRRSQEMVHGFEHRREVQLGENRLFTPDEVPENDAEIAAELRPDDKDLVVSKMRLDERKLRRSLAKLAKHTAKLREFVRDPTQPIPPSSSESSEDSDRGRRESLPNNKEQPAPGRPTQPVKKDAQGKPIRPILSVITSPTPLIFRQGHGPSSPSSSPSSESDGRPETIRPRIPHDVFLKNFNQKWRRYREAIGASSDTGVQEILDGMYGLYEERQRVAVSVQQREAASHILKQLQVAANEAAVGGGYDVRRFKMHRGEPVMRYLKLDASSTDSRVERTRRMFPYEHLHRLGALSRFDRHEYVVTRRLRHLRDMTGARERLDHLGEDLEIYRVLSQQLEAAAGRELTGEEIAQRVPQAIREADEYVATARARLEDAHQAARNDAYSIASNGHLRMYIDDSDGMLMATNQEHPRARQVTNDIARHARLYLWAQATASSSTQIPPSFPERPSTQASLEGSVQEMSSTSGDESDGLSGEVMAALIAHNNAAVSREGGQPSDAPPNCGCPLCAPDQWPEKWRDHLKGTEGQTFYD